MEHTFAHSRIARRLSLVSALAVAAIVVIAPMTRAADRLDVRTVSLSTTGSVASRTAMAVDSDGDGWTDWVERLHGTNPRDPSSHPLAVTAEIVGTTVYLQPPGFPDRMAVVSLALPEGTLAGSSILPSVTDVAGVTPNSKLGQQLKELFSSMYDGGVLATLMASLDKGKDSLPNFGTHTNGMDMSLVSSGDTASWEAWKKLMDAYEFVQSNDVTIGTTTGGEPFVQVRNSEGVQVHVRENDGNITSLLINIVDLGGGASVQHWTHLTNGSVDSYGKKVTNADGSTEWWDYDADGNETGHGKTGPKPSGGPGTNQPTVQPTADPTATAKPTGGGTGPTETATGDPTSKPTSSSSYTNPDADPYLAPTGKEVRDRIAFLTGVRVRTVENKPQVNSTLLPKPGVSDPADPACKGSMCVFFVEVSSPDLNQVAGGDPVPPDLADRTPPLH